LTSILLFHFQFEDYKQDLRHVIHGNNKQDGVYITLRMRLRCEIFRKGKAMPGKVFDILNEVVVDRGSNPYLSKIECYEHDRLITKVSLTMYLLSALLICKHILYSITRVANILI
jgi:NAD kinase